MGQPQLSHGLKVRHLTMMGLGSAIGAGLFVGTGQAISTAGPAVIISYLLAGAMVIVVMMLLAEMAAAMPSSGAFSTYAEKGVGRWAGFAVGWSYWFMLIMVLGVEILAATQIISGWFPSLPQWLTATTLVLIFAVVNLAGVKNFGEMEFWFAAIKIFAIIAFLIVGALLVTGVIPGPEGMGIQKMFSGEGGFAPRGMTGIAAGLLAVMFAFGGIEIITIAAAEATNPADSIKRATSSIMWRILVFYVGSILIMVMVLPWNDPALVEGSFVAVLNVAQIPGAATLMEIVIVVALLSAFNAQIYGTSRMAFSLSERGDGSRMLLKVSASQVPYVAVLVSVFFALVAVGLNALDKNGSVMGILLDAVGATLLIIWGFIALAQIKLRPQLEKAGLLKLRTFWHPYLGYLGIAAIGGFCVLMLFDNVGRRNLLITVGIFLVFVAIYFARRAILGKDHPANQGDRLDAVNKSDNS